MLKSASSKLFSIGAKEKFTRSPTDCLISPQVFAMFVMFCLVSVLDSSFEYTFKDVITRSTAAPFLSSLSVKSSTSIPSLFSCVVVPLYVFKSVVIDEFRSFPVTFDK